MKPISLLGAGFIGSHYAAAFPAVCVEPRDCVVPSCPDVLFTRSTVDNYWPLKGDLQRDIDTNLRHLMEVLPNVTGSFTFLSSWFVCANAGTSPDHPARESDCCRPTGFYSITKLAAEHLIQSYCATAATGLVKGPASYRILRLCNVIGNDPRAGKQKNALEHMLGKVVRGEAVQVYEGDNFRDYLHVDDVCRAIALCIEAAPLNAIVHIGRGESSRVQDLIGYAIRRTGSASRIERVPVPAFHQIVQVPDFWLDTTRLRQLGFAPRYTVWESIDKIVSGLA